MKKLLFVLLLCPALSAREFVNLTFDDPDLTNVRPFKPSGALFESQYAPVEEVFQGWTISRVFLDELDSSVFKGLANVDYGESTLSLTPASALGTPPYAVEVSNFLFDPLERSAFSLSQVGLVPKNAGTLRWWEGGDALEVYINGQPLPPQRLEPLGFLYEANVSAYAGQKVELSLHFAKGSVYSFDLVGFRPVPEPSSSLLLGLGLGWILLFRQQRKGGVSG